MGPFAIRQVILLPFPFSDLQGGLQRISHARAGKVFTAHERCFSVPWTSLSLSGTSRWLSLAWPWARRSPSATRSTRPRR